MVNLTFGILICSPGMMCLQIWQRVLLQPVLPLMFWPVVGNLAEVRSLLRFGGCRRAKRGGLEKIVGRVGSSLRVAKVCFKVQASCGIRG